MKLIKKYWFVSLFFVIIIMPLIFGKYEETVSYSENRTLAKLTKFYSVENGKFTMLENPIEMVREWYADHVGFREYSIKGIAMIKYYIFNTVEDEQTLVGTEGHWYYEGENRGNLINYQNIQVPLEETLAECAQVFSEFEERLSEKGIPLIMVMCCDKEAVYPEYMQESINEIGEMSRYETIYHYLEENTDLNIVFMQDVLMEHKDEGRLLYNKKYDVGHWNKVGAYFGYYELINRIKVYDKEIKIIQPDDINFIEKQVSEEILYGAVRYTDTIYEWEFASADSCRMETEKPIEMQNDSSVYYRWHNDEQDVKGKSILIVGDSYFHSFILPLVAQSFEDVYFVHGSSQYVSAWIEYVNPTYFVYESVERCGISYAVTK